MLQQGYAFYRQVGTRGMTVRSVTATPIDDAHWLARVAYRAHYEKPDSGPLDLDFAVQKAARKAGKPMETAIPALITVCNRQDLIRSDDLIEASADKLQ